jgi:GNAT superfamily N-acetyltransferase
VSGTLTQASLRNLTAADRGRIEEISRAVGLFRDDEVAVALEVFDAAAAGSADYTALGAEHDGRLAGWICWGPTPCTLGTFDLYWMAVDPALHGAGIGTLLCTPWNAGWPASPDSSSWRPPAGRTTRLPALSTRRAGIGRCRASPTSMRWGMIWWCTSKSSVVGHQSSAVTAEAMTDD